MASRGRGWQLKERQDKVCSDYRVKTQAMKISEASTASGCHQETIRYYERVGLMPPPDRTTGGYRVYTKDDVNRLQFISRGRELGFSLDEIRSLLRLNDEPNLSCEEVDQLARTHLVSIHERIAELRRMAEELDRVLAGCAGERRGSCAILGTLKH